MKKKNVFIAIIFAIIFFNAKNVYAFDVNNYRYKNLCGNYEVAGFHTDGVIDPVGCFGTFTEAKTWMVSVGADDLAIMSKVNGETKILDANVALLDLSVNPETLTYFYNNVTTNSAYTYMDTGSLYGGVDGAHMDSAYSDAKKKWMARVRVGNYTGWIEQQAYEIVPITWVKSLSSYTVTNSDIRHNYVAKIQNTYGGSNGSTIGPKPEMLSAGTYYSYDGHYFYNDIKTLIKDYKKNNYNNSINKNNPYYNYYMYLSNHTRTSYSSVNIDEYIRNNMGIKQNVYGNASENNSSRLYGTGTFFYYAQEKYGVNAILSLSLSRNETGNGTSNLAVNKNNGFGLNAVDSNPTQAANWYASFSSSILGYASKWITYGYAHPRDWRYFGPQFGDKWIGMNVKYASDTYWSEKMARNYYSLDRAFGLQDYNYYQLGVVTGPTNAYQEPSTSSRVIYQYPEAEDGLVIVDEVTRNNEKWYKVVSDLNIDGNYNEITSGNYNWNANVYVKASSVKKINKGKNGNISPNNVTAYQNKNYEYNLYVENAEFKPRVAITTKNTPYYYDSSLTAKTGKTLLKDRYVMVYTAAYLNNQPVAYLVTSDYWYDQKEWVSADSIKFTKTNYGKITVNVSGNQYTWVNYNTDDAKYSLISGLYTNSYVPLLETVNVNGTEWFRIPVSLTDNNYINGYTLAYAPGVSIAVKAPIIDNYSPTINASDKTIIEGTAFNELSGVTATDPEDGDLTSKIKVTNKNVNTSKAGVYQVTYQVTDSTGNVTTKTIKVTVKENKAPVINVSDKVITQNKTFNATSGVTATDTEDGDLTSKIKVVSNNVNTKVIGTYKVVYEVTDSHNKKTTKEIKVEVVKDRVPTINASDKVVVVNSKFNELSNVSAMDPEDGDITNKIKVVENTVKIDTIGTYKIKYQVTDSYGNKIEKTINVEVKEKTYIKKDGEFYLDTLNWDTKNKYFTISGYLIIYDVDNIDKEYTLIFKDKNSDKEYSVGIDSWTEKTPYDLGTVGGKKYTESWFKGKVDLKNIANGDYDIYMSATSGNSITEQLVDNLFNRPVSRRGEDDDHGYNFKVLQNLKSKKLELNIRDEVFTTKVAPTYRNMINDYEDIKFVNDKLYLLGTSYNYDGTYNNKNDIKRTLIVENQSTYKQTYYELGSTNKGPYVVNSLDKKDKSYAWYEKELDVSKLEPGTYSLQVYTKTKDAEDYGEIVDIFASVPTKEATINGKKYRISLNKDRQNRIELIVK